MQARMDKKLREKLRKSEEARRTLLRDTVGKIRLSLNQATDGPRKAKNKRK